MLNFTKLSQKAQQLLENCLKNSADKKSMQLNTYAQ